MKKRNLVFLLLLSVFTLSALSQVKIKGKILDDRKETIIGASVIEKGTRNGTVTDIDGNFTLSVSSLKASIVVSYVGMKSETVALNGKSEISITMESSSVELQEVVAVGYGNMRRSDLTGSISSVKVKDAETVPVVSVDQMLKGKSSGVYVNTGSAEPGGVSTVKIRGVNSLNGNTEPLYVIDGVAMDNVESGRSPFGSNSTVQRTNPLAYLSPQDIVNIEVLKDASATAIFGARGSNGVIIVTTKSGAAGATKVNVTSSLTVAQTRKQIQMLNGADYARYRNELALLEGRTDLVYGSTEATAPQNLNSVNWQDEVLQTSLSKTTRISLSGGTKTSNYYLSGGYDDNEGLVKNTAFKRGDIRFNFNTDLSTRLKLKFNISAAQVYSQMTQTTGMGGSLNFSAIRSMISKNPILTVVPTIESGETAMLNTPTAWINDYKNDNKEVNLMSNLSLNYKINKLLSFELRGSYNIKKSERFNYYGRLLSDYNEGAAGFSSVDYSGYNLDALLNFAHAFNKTNRISGVIGTTYSSNDLITLLYSAKKFPDDILGYEAMGSGNETFIPLTRDRQPVKSNSYLGRATYSLMDRYLITLSGRYDGSSKFPTGNKFGFFPSAALAWRVKEESFLKEVNAISNLKLRLGWGQTGSATFPAGSAPPDFVSDGNTTYFFGGVVSSGRQQTLGNLGLIWETSNQYNAGIDLGLFNERLSLNVDVYTKQNTDMIIKRPMIPSLGFSGGANPYVNFGTLENKGIDLSANFVIFDKKDFKWTVDGNISLYRNKIMKLGLEPNALTGLVSYLGDEINTSSLVLKNPGNIFIEGRAAGLFWGLQTAGIYQNQAEIDQYMVDNGMAGSKWYFNSAPAPGDIIYKNNMNDGKISSDDYAVIGNPNPDFTWGMGTNLTYKQFGLAIGVNGVQGKDILNANLNTENLLNGSIYNVRKEAYYNAWRGEGSSHYYPRISSATVSNYVTDRLIEDASFVRLSNITLSYTTNFNKKFFIKDLKLFVTGNNLMTLTKYSGFDPEVDSFAGNGMKIGMDNNSYPAARSVILGFNVNF
jgi:TonB-linked SusC/RagA family outer membrane protein